jgi:AraC-like DNA-binding protein
LKVPPAEFTDTFIELKDIWPQYGEKLLTELKELKSASHRMTALQQAIKIPETAIDPIGRAIEAMAGAHGNVNLDSLASQANISSRQFRRRCHEEAGLTPKQLCRILRFRHARQLAGASAKPNWSRIAAEAGYFDQAHLIRDFQEFTGRTPMSVLSNTRPATLA